MNPFLKPMAPRPLSPELRQQFRMEQQCSLGFAGLKPVHRIFI